jgi:hypothetical protein
MPEIIAVKPANLLADSSNPRIPEEGLSQREVLRAIAKNQRGEEILALAQDIVSQKSLDPSALPIVIRTDQTDRCVVLEGNRRLTAIRALENPISFEGVFSEPVLQQMRKLSTQYQAAPIGKIECCLVASAQEAQHWIDLRHTGKNGGAGLVEWGPHEKERHISRTRGETKIHTRLLNFLVDGGHLTKAERTQVPNAAFERLVKSKAVREKIGFSIDRQGNLDFKDEPSGVKGLLHIAQDLASGKTKTGDIYSREQRIDYANRIPVGATPSAKPTPTPAIPPAPVVSTATVPTKKTQLLRLGKEREKMIPSDSRLGITEPRIKRMARELQGLELEEYPNGIAVLFRVFLELSTDFYLVNTIKRTKTSLLPLSLSAKLLDVVGYLESTNVLSRQDAAPVKSACAKKSFLAISVLTMNEYIHNYLMIPTPTDLRAAWDGFEPFLKAIWP